MNTIDKYSNNVTPTWCPGCGDFSVLRSIKAAAMKLNIDNHDLAIVSGIGCSSRISGYINAYGFHSIHGRSLPVAQGIKLANQGLTVIATGGDGDGFAIGTNHTIHAMRRDIDITYIVMNNQVYGLTKGHTSPLSQEGFISKSTPLGASEPPLKPSLLALASGASFVAQGFSAQQDQLIDLIIKGINHKGFSFINVFSPCVTFNKFNTYQWFRENLIDLDKESGYEPSEYKKAVDKYIKTSGLFTGLLYKKDFSHVQDKSKEETITPMVFENLDIKKDFDELMKDFL
ncbi:2-oxoacid:ferredoxin oxidoreductase subunit beta [Maledivibacter halophilus]|uniref:2-oxoglutarate ferredoxin oxidoreductase subunit beta n=1 Tax=Maledivibacter halophilus TaxID=36842 RepID=A0A1T5M553_9FIRM|nr:2-oxoacid:ferredoxin oxidoreductase subunit beta [Maledivibacter halophilus]SKC83356.1 2-oxoglutarate ferredoxin oxidoreductase subunit beta [Maledivibacter halophilus]